MAQRGDGGVGQEALGERAFRRLLLALTLCGAVLRLVHLDSTLGYDEAETVKRYVEGGLPTIFAVHGGYGSTNNHLLNSLLSFAAVQAFGLHVWSLRLSSFVFGVLAVPLVGLVARRLTRDRLTAAVATFFAALSPILVSYAPACRGYGLLVFFALASNWLLLRAVEDGQRRLLPLLAVTLFLGGWSHMSGLVFAATCGLFTLVLLLVPPRAQSASAAPRSRSSHGRSAWLALGSVALAGVALTLWYSRGSLILQDVQSRLVHGTFVDPSLSGLKSVHRGEELWPWITHAGREFFGTGSRFLPVGLALAALGLARASWSDPRRGALLACGLLFPPVAFMAGNLKPFPRYFLFVQPYLLVAVAVALVWLVGSAARRTLRAPRATLAAVWAAALVLQVPALPLLRRNLTGPGANVMGIEWNVAAAVERIASELRPDDVVLSFLQPSVRGSWREWAFEQSASFHGGLRLDPLLARPASGAAGPRTLWYLTPERSLEGCLRFPPGLEPELVGRQQRCFVYRAELVVEALRPVPLPPFDGANRGLGGWRLEDPFSNVEALVDGSSAAGPIERVSLAVGHAGGDARIVSPPVAIESGRLVELRTAVSAEQAGGIRPCGVVTLSFLDAAGEPLARVARTAPLWEGLHPRDDWSDLRLTTLAPRGTRSLTVTLSLAPANPAGSIVHFRPPALFEAAVAR